MNFTLENKKYRFEATFVSKMNVITGDSGSGKSTIIRYLTEENSEAVTVITSDDFSCEVLDDRVFQNILKSSLSTSEGLFPYKIKPLTDKEQNLASQCKYISAILNKYIRKLEYKKQLEIVYAALTSLKEFWSFEKFHTYDKALIFIDDTDLIDTIEFATFFNTDKKNIYVSVNRCKLNKINYSVADRFIFKTNGREHYLINEFNYMNTTTIYNKKLNFAELEPVLIEDKKSGFIYFSNVYNKIESSESKDKILKCLENYRDGNLLLIADMCALGGLISDILERAKLFNIDLRFKYNYESFEYFLLTSEFISDTELNSYLEQNILNFQSKEHLYLQRLQEVTKDKYYYYSKSSDKFKKCYYNNCGKIADCIYSKCDKFDEFKDKEKISSISETNLFKMDLT